MLLSFLWFAELKNIPLLHKRRLLEHFSDPQTLYDTSEAELIRLGVPDKYCKALQEKDLTDAKRILKACNQKGIGILTVQDEAYPERLRHIPDAPLVLYYRGVLPQWNSLPVIGAVGTRKATAYGLQVARQMGQEMAAAGAILASGGALGGDAAAMEGALRVGGFVIGVLGNGVDILYPPQNRRLLEVTAQTGCLISEYPPGTKSMPWNFPARNRIISGISNAILVTEAPERSGALITAKLALEQGRDVFAVPGNIDSVFCAGSNGLLREGATAVLSGWDVVKEYEFLYPGKLQKVSPKAPAKVAQNPLIPVNIPSNAPPDGKISIDNKGFSTYSELDKKPALSSEEQAVLAQLTPEPQELAELIARLDMPAGKVLSILTLLTVKGCALKHPGGRVSRK